MKLYAMLYLADGAALLLYDPLQAGDCLTSQAYIVSMKANGHRSFQVLV